MTFVYAILSIVPIAGFAIAGVARVYHDVYPQPPKQGMWL